MNDSYTLAAPRIFTGTEWLENKVIVVENNRIADVVSSPPHETASVAYPGCIIAPAFIDAQIYGAHQQLFSLHPTVAALEKLADYCRRGGAAHFLPTVATNTPEVVYACIDAVRTYQQQGKKGIPGIHLEGPWLNPLKRGAHLASYIHSPIQEEVEALLEYGKGVVKMVTLAPEVCDPKLLSLLVNQDVVVSAGHSNATYEQAFQSFSSGITTVTHLFNAMSPLQHRAPGLAGAAMDHPQVMASIIPDGHHVDFAALRIAKKAMGNRLFAITDAVTETDKGPYPHQFAGDKYEAAGILSGSALTMEKALQNLIAHASIAVEEALRMCSLYPATMLRLHHQLGRIEKGFQACFVVLNPQLAVMDVLQ